MLTNCHSTMLFNRWLGLCTSILCDANELHLGPLCTPHFPEFQSSERFFFSPYNSGTDFLNFLPLVVGEKIWRHVWEEEDYGGREFVTHFVFSCHDSQVLIQPRSQWKLNTTLVTLDLHRAPSHQIRKAVCHLNHKYLHPSVTNVLRLWSDGVISAALLKPVNTYSYLLKAQRLSSSGGIRMCPPAC